MQGEFLLLSVKEKVLRIFAFLRVEDKRNQTPHFLCAEHVAFFKGKSEYKWANTEKKLHIFPPKTQSSAAALNLVW